jgi:hypothetical protein
MSKYRITGLPTTLTDEVRRTRKSPGYGHPVVAEVATGEGPCRSCLGLFHIGMDERLLFTYRPDSGGKTVGAPGPVFIHRQECARYDGSSMPADLLTLPLLIEGRRENGTVVLSQTAMGPTASELVTRVLADERIDFVFLRHGEAGCHIARVDRIRGPAGGQIDPDLERNGVVGEPVTPKGPDTNAL